VDDQAYRRYILINLPHARTLVERIGRSLDALEAFGSPGNGGGALRDAFEALGREAEPHDEDPPGPQALAAADRLAERGRALVAQIVATPTRGDRLGQLVRNLFECLGLKEEGAELGLQCGERPDSPLR
jgi:hypothetical protein